MSESHSYLKLTASSPLSKHTGVPCLNLVCIQMEKMYPADALCPEIESCCLLIQNILKRTKEGTKEEQAASKALASVSKVNAHPPTPTNPHNLTHVPLEI